MKTSSRFGVHSSKLAGRLGRFRVFGSWFLVLSYWLLVSCADDDEVATPKPRGYFRIDLPEKNYTKYEGDCPFTFEQPSYSFVEKDKVNNAEPCWLNMSFPKFKATVHLSYKKIETKNHLKKYLDDCYLLVSKQQVKASGIDQQVVLRDSAKVYGLVFAIEGNAASSLQFYLTDSATHFLRGSLYFNVRPNKDSLKPVAEFISKDVYKMVESLQWKK